MSAQAPARPATQLDPASRRRLAASARRLAWVSLGWMTIEGLIGVTAGVIAGSVVLTGFVLDSAIEGPRA